MCMGKKLKRPSQQLNGAFLQDRGIEARLWKSCAGSLHPGQPLTGRGWPLSQVLITGPHNPNAAQSLMVFPYKESSPNSMINEGHRRVQNFMEIIG